MFIEVHCFNRNKDGQFFRTCSVNKVCISDLFDLLLLNPFEANFSISYPLKKKKPKVFSGVFRGYKMGNWQEMRLVTSINPFLLKLLIRKFQKINQILLHKNEAVVTCSSVKIAFQS